MTVSVVIACRNEGETLPATLAALDAQDTRDFDVLVVDGGSTDGSAAYARARGFRVVEDPGEGPAAARNVGLLAARGDIIAFTDADCVPRFDWLTRLTAPFEDSLVAGVAGGLRLPRTTLLGRLEDNDARVRYHGYITSNVAYRREVLLAAGGFDGSLCCAEDYDLAWRLLDAGHRIVEAPDAIVLHAPPELLSLRRYLRRQFWYARHDIPTHARALARAWRAGEGSVGSRAATSGLGDALSRSAYAALALGAFATRAPLAGAIALGAAAAHSARDVDEVLRVIEEGAGERSALVATDLAKRIVRGAGTLVGLAELALAPPAAARHLALSGAAREGLNRPAGAAPTPTSGSQSAAP